MPAAVDPVEPSTPAEAGDSEEVALPGGLVLRPLAPRDLGEAGALLAARGDPSDAVDLELVVADPDAGPASVAVVVDGDRVVSTATLLDERLTVDGVAVPAGQVELVATDPAYEGRGLVRALMAWAHDRSRRRGHLAQVMIGIPYFYRQFGYSYAVPMHRWRPLVGPVGGGGDDGGVAVRQATVADVAAMERLQDAAQRAYRVAMPHSPACWRWLVARDGSCQWVAERDGAVVATGRSVPPGEGRELGELAADDPAAALAVVRHCHELLGGGELVVLERPGTVAGDAVEPLLGPGSEAEREWYYARVEDLGALLVHLGPVLARRLDGAGLGGERHELLLSTYRSHVRATVSSDGVDDVRPGGPFQAPVSQGGSGVPPDGLPSLLFGPHGALGLEERLPDCHLGRQRDLMAALFPPLTADLLTFYLPT